MALTVKLLNCVSVTTFDFDLSFKTILNTITYSYDAAIIKET